MALRLQECVSGRPQVLVLQLLQYLSELTELSGCVYIIIISMHHTAYKLYKPEAVAHEHYDSSMCSNNFQSGYSSVTGCIPLQAIRPALNNFCIGFTSMVGAQATKG